MGLNFKSTCQVFQLEAIRQQSTKSRTGKQANLRRIDTLDNFDTLGKKKDVWLEGVRVCMCKQLRDNDVRVREILSRFRVAAIGQF